MAFFETHDEIAAKALEICTAVRELGPLSTYRSLAVQCVREPERMAQTMMCLAAWVDVESPTSALVKRAEAITRDRVERKNAQVSS